MNSSAHKHIPIPESGGQPTSSAPVAAAAVTPLRRGNLALVSGPGAPSMVPLPANDPSDDLINECILEMRDTLLRLQTYQALRRCRNKPRR